MKKLTVGLTLLVLACLGASHIVTSQDRQPRKAMKEIPLDAAAALSNKQKFHRKYMKTSPGPKLRELAAKGTGEVSVTQEEPYVISTSPAPGGALTLPLTVCNVETIVVGTLTDDSPELTEDESFLFTEYTLNVEEVIKDKRATGLKAGQSVTVIREGGVGQIHGRVIRAEREGFKPFAVGTRYVLFLRDIPETGAYLAYPYGSFALTGDAVIPFGKMPQGTPATSAAFLDAVRSTAAASACVSQ